MLVGIFLLSVLFIPFLWVGPVAGSWHLEPLTLGSAVPSLLKSFAPRAAPLPPTPLPPALLTIFTWNVNELLIEPPPTNLPNLPGRCFHERAYTVMKLNYWLRPLKAECWIEETQGSPVSHRMLRLAFLEPNDEVALRKKKLQFFTFLFTLIDSSFYSFVAQLECGASEKNNSPQFLGLSSDVWVFAGWWWWWTREASHVGGHLAWQQWGDDLISGTTSYSAFVRLQQCAMTTLFSSPSLMLGLLFIIRHY